MLTGKMGAGWLGLLPVRAGVLGGSAAQAVESILAA